MTQPTRRPRRGETNDTGFDLELAPRTEAQVERRQRPEPQRTRRQRRTIEAISRPLPTIEEVRNNPTPQQRRHRERIADRASRDYSDAPAAFARSWTSFWVQLRVVGLPSALVAVIGFFTIGAWLGTAAGWIAAALPLVVFALWMRAVLRQGRRHVRGQAGPPPGWFGRW